MTPYEKLKTARMLGRPTSIAYIEHIVDGFIELHCDRCFMDDASIIGGVGKINGIPVTVIAQEKGTDIESRMERNFGCPNPEGYRKAMRLMKQAEKFHRPVLCLVDTLGAYCGVGAEERGQGFVIANNLAEMMDLKTPCISVVIGEGGSGGALALACSDRVYMLENSVYSILSPEGFASILWKDKNRAPEACEIMKITAQDLLSLQIIDGVIDEPEGGAVLKSLDLFTKVKSLVYDEFTALMKLDTDDLTALRYDRFRKIGCQMQKI